MPNSRLVTSINMRSVLYCRVSTTDQNVEVQLTALREYAERRGWQVAAEYVDLGVSGSKERGPALDKLMADARRRAMDAVVVFRFDRFARSVSHLARALDEFRALGIEFVSLHEAIDPLRRWGAPCSISRKPSLSSSERSFANV